MFDGGKSLLEISEERINHAFVISAMATLPDDLVNTIHPIRVDKQRKVVQLIHIHAPYDYQLAFSKRETI